MSANRKLQTEVDRVLKKVEEGVEEFDDIWGKVYSAPQQSLKEKYEGDLKKEIKKLQRLRDQIKTWIGSPDIKDKSALTEARKLIEVKMEEFKICEKETKTKAFSKEGLAREEKLNPREVEKEEKRSWIQGIVERVEGVIEILEADLEKMSNAKGKGKNKEQMEKLEARITTNRWHVSKLEQIHRLLDNDSLEPSKLDGIREELDYYVECIDNEDAVVGMESDEYNIYEELQLDVLSLGGPQIGKGDGEEEKEGEGKEDGSLPEAPIEEPPPPIPIPVLTTSTSAGAKLVPKKPIASAGTTSVVPTTAPAAPVVVAPSKLTSVISTVGTKTAASVVAGSQVKASTPAAKSVAPLPTGQKAVPTAASIVATNLPPTTSAAAVAGAKTTPMTTAAKIVAGEKKSATPAVAQSKPETRKDPTGPTPVPVPTPLAGSWAHAATSGQRIGALPSQSPQPSSTPKQPSPALAPVNPPVENLPQPAEQPPVETQTKPDPIPSPVATQPIPDKVLPVAKLNETETQSAKPAAPAPQQSPSLTPKPVASPLLNATTSTDSQPSTLSLEDSSKGSGMPPLHRTAPSQPAQPPATTSSVLSSPGPSQGLPPPQSTARATTGSQELQALANMLRTSMMHIPPADIGSDRNKPYAPRNPFNGVLHPSFPTQPHPIIENPALFERLPMDTLFLAFYYQQGSYQQYLAARQLKKHSWRFHKKYMTWFQRHEEPKTTTNDYEEGTYVYFDYESGWCQRIKSEFKFEYAYLEDELAQAGMNPHNVPPSSVHHHHPSSHS